MSLGKAVGSDLRQIRGHNPDNRDEALLVPKSLMPCFQEKLLSYRHNDTVPETDTGGQVENTKALERTLLKELGKLAP